MNFKDGSLKMKGDLIQPRECALDCIPRHYKREKKHDGCHSAMSIWLSKGLSYNMYTFIRGSHPCSNG